MSLNSTLLGQMITFLLFVWFTKQYVWPPVLKALKDRQATIADGLAAAERGHVELARAQTEGAGVIKVAHEKASGLLNEAKAQKATMIENARHQAQEEAKRIVFQGHQEVNQMRSQAKEELRQQVALLAIEAAEKILNRSTDIETHREMMDKLVQEL